MAGRESSQFGLINQTPMERYHLPQPTPTLLLNRGENPKVILLMKVNQVKSGTKDYSLKEAMLYMIVSVNSNKEDTTPG